MTTKHVLDIGGGDVPPAFEHLRFGTGSLPVRVVELSVFKVPVIETLRVRGVSYAVKILSSVSR